MKKIDPKTYEPTGYRVLVRDDEVDEKVGGIILPDSAVTSDEYAQQFGTVVRKGGFAFSMETPTGRVFDDAAPNVGDVVNYTKWAGGQYYEDEDGLKYRIVNDDDVIGIIQRNQQHEKPDDFTAARPKFAEIGKRS